MNNYIETLDALTERTKEFQRRLEDLYDITDESQRNELLGQAAIDGEILAKDLRRLLILTSTSTKEAVYHQACAVNNFSVRAEGNVTVITMPPLPLRERNYKNFAYFIAPLYCCLQDYTQAHEVEKYDRCIVEIKHCFPRDTPLRYLHDYDNLEVKKMIDTVALFFLIDDNIRKCQVHHLGEESDSLRTEVRIIPLYAWDKNA